MNFSVSLREASGRMLGDKGVHPVLDLPQGLAVPNALRGGKRSAYDKALGGISLVPRTCAVSLGAFSGIGTWPR